jgi:hypothetical protein
MTDTPHDIDEHHVVYKGQLHRCIAVKPYIRADGSTTHCPVCGELFTIETVRLRKPRDRIAGDAITDAVGHAVPLADAHRRRGHDRGMLHFLR